MRTIQLEYYEEKADLSGCRALWLAVIYRALCDACYQCFDQYQLNKNAALPHRYVTREDLYLADWDLGQAMYDMGMKHHR